MKTYTYLQLNQIVDVYNKNPNSLLVQIFLKDVTNFYSCAGSADIVPHEHLSRLFMGAKCSLDDAIQILEKNKRLYEAVEKILCT